MCSRRAPFATALRDLMRRGMDGRGGLDRLADKIRKLRAQARRRGELGGDAGSGQSGARPGARRRAGNLGRQMTSAMRGWRSWSWKRCPTMSPGQVRGLDQYPWRSEEAREIFEAIKNMLQREVLDAQFAGIKAGARVAGS